MADFGGDASDGIGDCVTGVVNAESRGDVTVAWERLSDIDSAAFGDLVSSFLCTGPGFDSARTDNCADLTIVRGNRPVVSSL